MKDLESIDPEFYNSLVWIKYEIFYSSSKGNFFLWINYWMLCFNEKFSLYNRRITQNGLVIHRWLEH